MGAAPLAALAPRWLVLRSEAADGATNMAVDAALMAHARRHGAATLRLYTWDRPTLSLGRNERARDVFDPARIAAAGVGVVRRPTGGRALLHHRELTYSVTAPDAVALAASYAAINALLLRALALLGVTAHAAERSGRPLRPEGAACFAEPAAGELVVDGAKLVGSAQLREEGALLQHGSILIADDQPLIERLRHVTPPVDALPSARVPGDGSPETRASDARDRDARRTRREGNRPLAAAATLQQALGRPIAAAEVADALEQSLRQTVPAEPLDPALLRADLARLVIAFADPAWTWRR